MIKAYDKKGFQKNLTDTTSTIRPEMLNKVGERIEIALEENNKIRPKYTNCKNCGAPLKSDECEYCGTQYGKE